MILTWVDIFTNFVLVWSLNKISVVVLAACVTWMTVQFVKFMKNPEAFKLVDKVEKYTYVQESVMLLTVAVYLLVGAI
jgi:4-hydroxybenzoate polyprenyltransferase